MNLSEFRAWAAPRCQERPHMGDDMPCLIWQGATINRGRHPRAIMQRGGPPVQVRREIYAMLHPGKPLGMDAFKPACGCDLCIEPTHLERVPPSVYRSVRKSLVGRMNMQRAARAARSKVQQPEVIVPMVIADERSAPVLARELGLGVDVIRDIRRGRWSAQGNMFGQLIGVRR